MTQNKLRVGVIGAGEIAIRTRLPALVENDQTEPVAVCRRNREALQIVQEAYGVPQGFTDWREMLDSAELDAVFVCSPHDLHAEHILGALERGLHVLTEKPLALTSADAWAIVEAAERANLVVYCQPPWQLPGVCHSIKMRIESGDIGPLRQIVASHSYPRKVFWLSRSRQEMRALLSGMWDRTNKRSGHNIPFSVFHDRTAPDDWRSDPSRQGGGAMANNGLNHLSAELWLGGAPPEVVSALNHAPEEGTERISTLQARLTSDVLLTITVADVAVTSNRTMVYGDKGVIHWDRIGRGGKEVLLYHQEGLGPAESMPVEVEPQAHWLPPFVAAVRGEIQNPSPPRLGAHLVDLVSAAYRSAAEGGRPIEIEQH
jgi:predicted dehydrogenase